METSGDVGPLKKFICHRESFTRTRAFVDKSNVINVKIVLSATYKSDYYTFKS